MSHCRIEGAAPRRAASIRRGTEAVAAAGLILLLSSGQAYAYLDPGTGSVLLQLLLGGVAGIAMAARLYWARIKALLGIRPRPEPVRIEPE